MQIKSSFLRGLAGEDGARGGGEGGGSRWAVPLRHHNSESIHINAHQSCHGTAHGPCELWTLWGAFVERPLDPMRHVGLLFYFKSLAAGREDAHTAITP